MVRLEDWRDTDASDLAPLVADDARAWVTDLDWDVEEAWRPIEPARRAGLLPGFVARDEAGRIRGWTCFLLHRRTLQVAMLSADALETTAALVDAILDSPEAAGAELGTVCVRDRTPGLGSVLRARGYELEIYRYLSAPVGDWRSPKEVFSTWGPSDLDAMARLSQRAYAGSTELRAFAPLDTWDEWREYVTGLATSPGCGRLIAGASFVSRRPGGEDLDAAILTTRLAPMTAHIAQLVVDPARRRSGVGRALVASAFETVRALGFVRVTLLVAQGNGRAAGLYDRFGFRDRAAFLVATMRQPRRLRSVALATGGASTRL